MAFSPAKLVILAGVLLVVVGLIMLGMEKIPWLGRLPGDIHVERPGFSFHFPIVTSIILSIVLSIILNIIMRNR